MWLYRWADEWFPMGCAIIISVLGMMIAWLATSRMDGGK